MSINVKVAVVIVLGDLSDAVTNDNPERIGVFINDNKWSLPAEKINEQETASHIAVRIIKDLIHVDLRRLTIEPIGFFDPVDVYVPGREITLAYRVLIYPGIPVKVGLEFKTYDELKETASGNRQNDLSILRAAIYGR